MRDSEKELSDTEGIGGEVRSISSYEERKGALQVLSLIFLSFSRSSFKATVFSSQTPQNGSIVFLARLQWTG